MISKRITAKIEELWAEAPELKSNIEEASWDAACESLGVTAMLSEVADLKEQNSKLEATIKQKEQEVLAFLLNSGTKNKWSSYSYDPDSETTQIIRRRQSATRKIEMAKYPVAMAVQSLQEEEQNLHETVWLDIGTASVKALWDALLNRLSQSATELQRQAIDIPVDDVIAG